MEDRRFGDKHSFSKDCYSVFFGNLSPKVHWSLLKKHFQRFGRVLDVVIPHKRDKLGANFGFVRFPSKQEAKTTIYMFERVWIVDRRIQVNIAKFRSRSKFWRKKRPQDIEHVTAKQNDRSNDNVPENRPVEEDRCSPEVTIEGTVHTKLYRAKKGRVIDGESSNLTESSLKRITGHVNDEALRRLERLLSVQPLQHGLDEACIGDKEGSCRKTDVEVEIQLGVLFSGLLHAESIWSYADTIKDLVSTWLGDKFKGRYSKGQSF
ncbi:hypothetical protein V6N13_106874 [Hibiscus sabdariffa]